MRERETDLNPPSSAVAATHDDATKPKRGMEVDPLMCQMNALMKRPGRRRGVALGGQEGSARTSSWQNYAMNDEKKRGMDENEKDDRDVTDDPSCLSLFLLLSPWVYFFANFC